MNHLGDLLSALLDGELDASERAAAERHLTGCPGCGQELAAVAEARHLLRSLPAIDPPFGAVERARRAERRRMRPLVWAAAAAAVAGLLGLSVRPPGDDVEGPAPRFVEAHVTSSPLGDPVSELAPVVPVSFSE